MTAFCAREEGYAVSKRHTSRWRCASARMELAVAINLPARRSARVITTACRDLLRCALQRCQAASLLELSIDTLGLVQIRLLLAPPSDT